MPAFARDRSTADVGHAVGAAERGRDLLPVPDPAAAPAERSPTGWTAADVAGCRQRDLAHRYPMVSRRPRRMRREMLAAEPAAPTYDGSEHGSDRLPRRTDDPSTSGGQFPVQDLAAAIDRLTAIDVDALPDTVLRDHLSELRRPLARLTALRADWSARLEARAIASAPPQSRGVAQRQARQQVAQAQQLTPTEAKRAVEAGRAAQQHPDTGRAFRAGELSPDHVRLIDELLAVVNEDDRADFERNLLELARHHDATRFGRKARSLLADLAPAGVAAIEGRKRGRRRLRATDTPDGGFAFSGLLYGTAAETARVALDAFSLPDAAGERRTPEQRAADGFEQLCAAALRTGDAPAQHGARPQVLVILEAAELARLDRGEVPGAGRFGRSGQPVSTDELGALLDDCQLVRIVRDAARTPIEVSEAVRTVPAGLWRALLARDGGCTWSGCDAPAAWCDVAHGHTPYAQHGRLRPDNAALLCRRHHRRFDHGPWRISVVGDTVTYHRTDLGSEPTGAPGSPSRRPGPDGGRASGSPAALQPDPPGASALRPGAPALPEAAPAVPEAARTVHQAGSRGRPQQPIRAP